MHRLSNSELAALIDEHISGRNAQRNRAIMKRKLIDGITYEQLAEEYEISVTQAKMIVYKGEYILSSFF